MSAKTSPRRRAAFFKALRETGNQTLAAEAAKVSRSWVCLHRTQDAAFDAEVRAALRQARDRLGVHGERRPPSGWGFLDGEELVVRGSPGRRVQVARARLRQITPRVEARFLGTLALTCNVKAACAEAGIAFSAMYGHRERWPAFARRWDEAVAEGYARIEAALLENGCNLFSKPEHPPEMPMPDMTAAHAIHLLHMHKHAARGIGKAPGKKWRRPRTLEEVGPSILRKLQAFERARGRSEAETARNLREYARRRVG